MSVTHIIVLGVLCTLRALPPSHPGHSGCGHRSSSGHRPPGSSARACLRRCACAANLAVSTTCRRCYRTVSISCSDSLTFISLTGLSIISLTCYLAHFLIKTQKFWNFNFFTILFRHIFFSLVVHLPEPNFKWVVLNIIMQVRTVNSWLSGMITG